MKATASDNVGGMQKEVDESVAVDSDDEYDDETIKIITASDVKPRPLNDNNM